MQAFLRQIGSRATPGQTQFIVRGLRESLGLQNITLHGVPANSHYAQVLVEADYRMKLIGIGLEKPKHVKMMSYVDRASSGGGFAQRPAAVVLCARLRVPERGRRRSRGRSWSAMASS